MQDDGGGRKTNAVNLPTGSDDRVFRWNTFIDGVLQPGELEITGRAIQGGQEGEPDGYGVRPKLVKWPVRISYR
jgi:hypothetical protein